MKAPFETIRRSLQNFSHVRRHVQYDGDLLHKPDGQTDEPLPRQFRLLLWNVFKGGFGATFEHDISRYAETADLLCLQEVLYQDGPQLPCRLADFAYDYSPSYSRQDALHEGVMTLSRHPLCPLGKRLLSLGSEPWVATPKSAVVSRVPITGGGKLTVLNIHMLLVRSQRAAMQELAAALDLLESVASPDAAEPMLFVGDLNTLLPRQLALVDGALAQRGFTRVKPAVEPRRLRLDHIYSRHIKAAELTVDANLASSDHPALICDITL